MTDRRTQQATKNPLRPSEMFSGQFFNPHGLRSKTIEVKFSKCEMCRVLVNKAAYTATSCGRVGRGGNARFSTFRLVGYGRTDGQTDGQSLL